MPIVRYEFDRFELDPGARRLRAGGVELPVGGRAFDLLIVLLEHADRVVAKDELHERVWPGRAVESNNLQVQVWALRRLLGAGSIVTVARRGYRMALPVTRRVSAAPPPDDSHPPFEAPPAGIDEAARQLSARTARHPIVTLIGANEATRRRVAHALSRHPPMRGLAGTWHVEPRMLASAAAGGAPGAGAVLRRLSRVAALLVAHEPRAGGSAALGALRALLDEAPALRLVATGEAPLEWPLEHVTALPRDLADDTPALDRRIPGACALRWRRLAPRDGEPFNPRPRA